MNILIDWLIDRDSDKKEWAVYWRKKRVWKKIELGLKGKSSIESLNIRGSAYSRKHIFLSLYCLCNPILVDACGAANWGGLCERT